MCLHPRSVDPVPEQTTRVARAAFPKGTTYMTMRDELGAIFEDEDFAHLFPRRGQPAMAPWRLALVTIMQFAEGLSDRQAADAVRARIDCKYALSLELSDPGFDASVLCEFRGRLLEGDSGRLLFDHLLERFRKMGLVKARGKQRTDSTRILAVVRGLNRLELVGETVRHALDALATVAPGWLRGRIRPEWERRYVRRFDDHRLPKSKEARMEEGERIGADGRELLEAVLSEDAPHWLREVPAVETLRKVWLQNFFRDPEGNVRWRTAEEGIPPSRNFLGSPIDPDCRYARKFTTSWLGYRVHLTEACDEDLPSVLTDVRTAPATVADGEATPLIHETLEEKGLLPQTQFVDTGYLERAFFSTMFVRRLDALGYARLRHRRIYGEEGLARCEVALWLGEDGLTVEYGGDTLARYDVSFPPGEAKLGDVTNARLFATRHRSPQLKLFALEDALGDTGWLKALALDGYSARSRAKPDALQQVLFPYLDAP